MNKKEEFKKFVNNNPSLIKYVKNKEKTWQDFYELYDLYGDDEKMWKEYISNDNDNLKNITDMIRNVDLDSVKEHIKTAQKALEIVQELTSKETPKVASKVLEAKKITSFFED